MQPIYTSGGRIWKKMEGDKVEQLLEKHPHLQKYVDNVKKENG